MSGLEEGSRGPEELTQLYMILGQISASLGEEAEAESYFQAALSLSEDATLPEGVSPKIGEPFSRAKDSLADSAPIALLSEFDSTGLLSVQISSDPAELVGGVEVRYQDSGEEQRKRAKGIGTLRLELAPSATEIQVLLIDPHGNHLTSFEKVDSGTPAPEAAVKTEAPPKDGRSVLTRWEPYAGLAVCGALAGAYFGNVSRSKSDEIAVLEDGTEFRIAQGLQDDAERNALYSNLSFAAALGAGAVSLWLFLDDAPKSKNEKSSESALVTPSVAPGEVGVSAQFSF